MPDDKNPKNRVSFKNEIEEGHSTSETTREKVKGILKRTETNFENNKNLQSQDDHRGLDYNTHPKNPPPTNNNPTRVEIIARHHAKVARRSTPEAQRKAKAKAEAEAEANKQESTGNWLSDILNISQLTNLFTNKENLNREINQNHDNQRGR